MHVITVAVSIEHMRRGLPYKSTVNCGGSVLERVSQNGRQRTRNIHGRTVDQLPRYTFAPRCWMQHEPRIGVMIALEGSRPALVVWIWLVAFRIGWDLGGWTMRDP